MLDTAAWVPLADVARPHGVRGELRLRLFNHDSDVLLEVDEVLVRLPDGEEHEVSVDRARRADSAILLKLHSVDDRDRADELRGALICVRRSDFAPLEEGEFYCCDVIGSEVVFDESDGTRRVLGTLLEVCSYPSVDTLLVQRAGKKSTFEVPLVAAYVGHVDSTAKVVQIVTLEGLDVDEPVAPPKPEAIAPPEGEVAQAPAEP